MPTAWEIWSSGSNRWVGWVSTIYNVYKYLYMYKYRYSVSRFQPYLGERRQLSAHPCLFEYYLFCLCWSMWLAMCIYIVFVCIHACLPIRNLCSPLPLAGPEDKEQQQSHTHQAIGFSNLSHLYCWCCQKPFLYKLLPLTTSFLTAVKNGEYDKPYAWFQLCFFFIACIVKISKLNLKKQVMSWMLSNYLIP